ncbi:GfV-C11-ORF1 [Ichnoviriform fumiferanae]|uniref:GfV-C11-ORF1 n=1 Tax=Ichnoviriform fumiferanae TaxID=419435 RepID=A2PZX7_9VIRU|nr:GfV-C11-ORF1 [Ichnoviriform fumiferanae]BAF45549.1 GfV-C11-ORF1 [Ichnoviriform fumiferanae]
MEFHTSRSKKNTIHSGEKVIERVLLYLEGGGSPSRSGIGWSTIDPEGAAPSSSMGRCDHFADGHTPAVAIRQRLMHFSLSVLLQSTSVDWCPLFLVSLHDYHAKLNSHPKPIGLCRSTRTMRALKCTRRKHNFVITGSNTTFDPVEYYSEPGVAKQR